MSGALIGGGSLWEALGEIPDRRGRKGQQYPLRSVLVLALAAMLSGANDLRAMFRWGRRLPKEALYLLGIPGNAAAAAFLAALELKNVVVGPSIQIEHPGLIYFIYFALIIANFLMYGMAIVLVKPCVKLFALPRTLLMPLIIPLCVVGAFAINLNYFDVYVMFGAGLVGFLLDRFGFPLAPMVLGVILGPLADENLRRALLIFEDQPAWSLITDHPIGSVLVVIVLFTFYDGIFRRGR